MAGQKYGQKYQWWVGLGAGYEILQTGESNPLGTGTTEDRGWELGNGQLGLDFTISPAFAVGPFGAFSVAQYMHETSWGHYTVIGGTTRVWNSTTAFGRDQSIHTWLMIGVRGVFNIGL